MKTMKRFPLVLAAVSVMGASVNAATNYVWQESPNPNPPYSSWETAAHVIQGAVDAAANGDTVLVTNGVYATGGCGLGRVAVDKPLRLLSVNGPEFTIIQGYQVPVTTNGDGAVRCVYLADGAFLSGFTLTNGQDYRGGGVDCESTNAVITNCTIRGNAAWYRGGGALGGTLYSCSVVDNVAFMGGGVYESTLNHCLLSGNSAGDNIDDSA